MTCYVCEVKTERQAKIFHTGSMINGLWSDRPPVCVKITNHLEALSIWMWPHSSVVIR